MGLVVMVDVFRGRYPVAGVERLTAVTVPWSGTVGDSGPVAVRPKSHHAYPNPTYRLQ
jgi:hypothetical protein